MLQVPSLPPCQAPQPSYNAVKIDIHNPSVNAPGCPVSQPIQPQYTPQYEQVTAPYYSYPQSSVYGPTAMNQPIYYPQVQVPQVNNIPAAPVNVQPQTAVQAQPAVQQVNINQAPQAPAPVAVAPAPVIVQEPANVNPVEIAKPQTVAPQVDLNDFIAKLTNPDFEVQASVMENIANIVKEKPEIATELLDTKIIDQLNNIINADLSKLAGPTQEQTEMRSKLANGEKLSEQDSAFALTITPMEQANRNKIYAMYTLAILDKLYGDEISKMTNKTVPLTELPAVLTIVDQLKDNPHPMVRSAAIDSLSYLQAPEYKQELNTLFTIAKNDVDPSVQDAATKALEKLNQA